VRYLSTRRVYSISLCIEEDVIWTIGSGHSGLQLPAYSCGTAVVFHHTSPTGWLVRGAERVLVTRRITSLVKDAASLLLNRLLDLDTFLRSPVYS